MSKWKERLDVVLVIVTIANELTLFSAISTKLHCLLRCPTHLVVHDFPRDLAGLTEGMRRRIVFQSFPKRVRRSV